MLQVLEAGSLENISAMEVRVRVKVSTPRVIFVRKLQCCSWNHLCVVVIHVCGLNTFFRQR